MNRNQINWPAWIVTQSKHGMAMVFGSPGTGKTAIAGVAAITAVATLTCEPR